MVMMMDLNEESSSSASVSAEKSAVDESGPSVSEEEEGFRFGILKEADSSFLTTRQLFPTEIGAGSSSSASPAIDFGRVNSQQPPKKVRRGPRSRSSQYRGVTFYRRTGRWESHIWDCGKQVYLGGFDTADAAARAYDRAAIKFRGVEADINFTLNDYKDDLMQTSNMTKEEFVHVLRRQSTGFGRGASKYRGIMRPQHKFGVSEAARTGQPHGNKAYDNAAIKYDGREVVSSGPSYAKEMLPGVAIEAIGHDLDLNLRISQPNNTSPKSRDNPMGIQVHFGSFQQYSDAKKARINNASIAGDQPHGLLMAPEPSKAWTGIYPSLFPRTEGRAAEKR